MHDHHQLGPCGPGTVMMDIGTGAGALIIYTSPAEIGREIDISPVGGPRTHVAVRTRRLAGGEVNCAFFPRLAAGDYTIWHDATTPAATVTIAEGQVAEITYAEA
ncbi:hypothetical protein Cme02nite_03510 [Catellatospora methionotrophica]|uniref:Phospholipase n=1 Tax=Catellatospora methionotrophica TaxID=121620 RepID=A0A8J3PCU8_9ACTN|nr:phospholipase [Catellatospora methionotrophica]GIG12019.1 hypothetical protein Cme02nite_03510 [Catellatospora methionotrophica]